MPIGICKLYQVYIIHPLGWFVHHIHAKHVFNHLIYPVCLPICLCMVGSFKVHLSTQIYKKTFSKVRFKLCISVRYNLGKPSNLNISFMNTLAISSALCIDLTGIKCVALENISSTTMVESCFFKVVDNSMINSSVTTSHFHYGIDKGYNKPTGC